MSPRPSRPTATRPLRANRRPRRLSRPPSLSLGRRAGRRRRGRTARSGGAPAPSHQGCASDHRCRASPHCALIAACAFAVILDEGCVRRTSRQGFEPERAAAGIKVGDAEVFEGAERGSPAWSTRLRARDLRSGASPALAVPAAAGPELAGNDPHLREARNASRSACRTSSASPGSRPCKVSGP